MSMIVNVAVLKRISLVLVGGLAGLGSSELLKRKEFSTLSCNTRLTIIADQIKPLFVAPLQDSATEAIIGMITPEKKVLVKLSVTEGNWLFENQCLRGDGKKVSIQVQESGLNE